MEEVNLGEILSLAHGILVASTMGTDDNAALKPELRMEILRQMRELRPHCQRLGLLVPVEYIEDACRNLKGPFEGQTGIVARVCNLIFRTIEIELRGRLVFAVQPQRSSFFANPHLFGEDVSSRFPGDASFELDEAGKCYALGRYTACVFHLMRLMEIGITAARRCLDIPDPIKPAQRNWGAILKAFRDECVRRNSLGVSGWKNIKDKDLFEDIYASLDAVRNPWRNAAMHIESKYIEDDAEHIFIAVKGFMKKLASRMDENGEPKA